MKRLIYLLLLMPVFCFGQDAAQDTSVFSRPVIPYTGAIEQPVNHFIKPKYRKSVDAMSPQIKLDFGANSIVSYMVIPGMTEIALWDSGSVFASGSTVTFPGMMGLESGSLNLRQQVGDWTFTGSLVANKYGYFHGLVTQYGISGAVNYRINDNMSVTAFGAYYSNNTPFGMTPAMIGFYGNTRFGGYMDFKLGERWGVKVGAQAQRRFGYNHFDVAPIVAPYLKINGKTAIEIDVGELLYGIISTAVNRNRQFNPTIASPIQGPLPICPR